MPKIIKFWPNQLLWKAIKNPVKYFWKLKRNSPQHLWKHPRNFIVTPLTHPWNRLKTSFLWNTLHTYLKHLRNFLDTSFAIIWNNNVCLSFHPKYVLLIRDNQFISFSMFMMYKGHVSGFVRCIPLPSLESRINRNH